MPQAATGTMEAGQSLLEAGDSAMNAVRPASARVAASMILVAIAGCVARDPATSRLWPEQVAVVATEDAQPFSYVLKHNFSSGSERRPGSRKGRSSGS